MSNLIYSDWYVINTLSGKEESIKYKLIENEIIPPTNLLLPKRKLLIRKQRQYFDTEKVLFPGYLFYKGDYFVKIYQNKKNLKGFIKVINNDLKPLPLYQFEIDKILNMVNEDELIDYSKMIMEGDLIKVISGPLVNMEGIIKKIDKRKERVWVEFSLFGRVQLIQLTSKIIEKI
ncbi:MAG TPA: antiterminator LoaP [bacterium]|nr:antiterminator LoaP [bacterium]